MLIPSLLSQHSQIPHLKAPFLNLLRLMGLFKLVYFLLAINLFAPKSIYSLTIKELAQIPIDFLEFAKKPEITDYMIKIRRKIHENPELGFEEFETSKLIRVELDHLGIPYKHRATVTGVVGYIRTGQTPFVAIRADMDAPAMEDPTRDFALANLLEAVLQEIK